MGIKSKANKNHFAKEYSLRNTNQELLSQKRVKEALAEKMLKSSANLLYNS